MSRVIPDPQIISLRAMRSGDIAFALPSPVILPVGVSFFATAQPIVSLLRTIADAVPDSVGIAGTPSEAPIQGSAFSFTLTDDVFAATSLLTANSLETLAGNPSESPVLSVGKSTSVV